MGLGLAGVAEDNSQAPVQVFHTGLFHSGK